MENDVNLYANVTEENLEDTKEAVEEHERKLEEEEKERELYKVKFSKPYKFENEEYKELDLYGLKNLTGNDLAVIEKMYIAAGGSTSVNPEKTWMYALFAAEKVTDVPVSFFVDLPARECMKIRNLVKNFFGIQA